MAHGAMLLRLSQLPRAVAEEEADVFGRVELGEVDLVLGDEENLSGPAPEEVSGNGGTESHGICRLSAKDDGVDKVLPAFLDLVLGRLLSLAEDTTRGEDV